MKKHLRPIAFILSLVLVLLCGACGGGDEPATTAPIDDSDITATTSEAVTNDGEITTAADVEGSTDTAATEPELVTDGTEATTEAVAIVAPVGGTAAEIVTFYNERANATKNYQGKVTIDKKEGTTTSLDEISIGMVRGLAEDMLPNDYPKTSSRTFTNGVAADGNSIKGFIPIDDSSKMSTLSASGVKSASCVADGDGWKVVLTLKSESGNDINFKPPYHAACMDTLALTAKDLEPFTLNNATITYKGATLTAKVNSDGLLTYFDVDEPVYVAGNLGYKAFNLIDAVVSGMWQQTATFKY